jgi:predicted nucleotidyltransferase
MKSEKWQIKLEKIIKELKRMGIKKIILFGSRARGDYKKNSDIDIAISGNFNYREKRELKELVDFLAGIYSVDLIFLDNVEEDFKRQILKEGKIL